MSFQSMILLFILLAFLYIYINVNVLKKEIPFLDNIAVLMFRN